jgi:hypothetical protein
METMVLTPIRSIKPVFKPFKEIEDAVVINDTPVNLSSLKEIKERKQFIEANTKEVDLGHLTNDCVIPVFSKDNEVTISHSNFIETVFNATSKVFPNERIDAPEIRVSHVIKGRIPEAIHKSVNQLLERDKTIYYERMAFVMEIPTIYEEVKGNPLVLSIGGVRAYNHENLYSKKTLEKFKVFIGFKNRVCCNLCISTDGFQEEIKAMSSFDLQQSIVRLFQRYDIAKHLYLLQSFQNYSLTEHQFAQLIGKSKLYQCLPVRERKQLPALEFNDSHLNIIARNYYRDASFGKNRDNSINLWNVYNLFTGANKNSYIDTFLHRAVNATDFLQGITEVLNGNPAYRWFIE